MPELWKLIRFVKPYWQKSLLSMVLLIAVVIMDLAIPRLVQRIIDQGINQQNMDVVVQTSLVMFGISILNMILAIGNNNFSVQVGESVARDLREALFLKIQAFSFGNLDVLKTGQLLVRLTSDASVFQRLVQVSLRIGSRAPLLMVGSIILMFNTDRTLALTIVPILIVTSLIMGFFIVRMGGLFRTALLKLDQLNNVLQENIAGVRVVKSFVRASFEKERFEAANKDYTDRHIRVMQFMSTMSPALTVFLNIGIVVVVWAGGLQSIRGELTTGQIVAFVNYLQTTMGPLMIMVMVANVVAAGIASAERVNQVLEVEPEVQDAEAPTPLPAADGYRVEFDRVSFYYNGAHDQPVLQEISLQAEPGTTVAILGATGSGKTTLVNLIPRFYDAVQGRVLINGMDVRQLKQDELLSLVGIVPQETVLFSGSVRDNIRYGRPQASDEEVYSAARAAQAHSFIQELPEGYDTQVNQRGVNLSGGQKQRIAIARALLTQPAILILDDSTSSVDVETETKIQAALEHWQPRHTTFIVAQRISTVLNADKILVIDKGSIAAQGTHAELMHSSPIYREIYDSQLGEGVKFDLLDLTASTAMTH
ncbi:MAG: ABC transporter ATP-binding protein/permease, partial [Anaerolineales bacterium]|jgi:ATP-binding cassette subfamily B protein|nr:ABC transporter ATP-binding protein/permease [Anaerolineales bacterium]